jgi:hypothetical protein
MLERNWIPRDFCVLFMNVAGGRTKSSQTSTPVSCHSKMSVYTRELHIWNFSPETTLKGLKIYSKMFQMRCLLLKFGLLFALYNGPTTT